MKPFAKIRAAMVEKGIDQAYLARYLKCGRSYITERINGYKPWTLEDCYKILDLIGCQPEAIFDFFPPQKKIIRKAAG